MQSRLLRTGTARGPRLAVLGIVGAILGLAMYVAMYVGAAPARAIVVVVGGRGYGVTPVKGVAASRIPGAYRSRLPPSSAGRFRYENYDGLPKGGGPLIYHGGPVMHSNTTRVIYWDPANEFTGTTHGIIRKFFSDVAHDSGLASNVFGIAGQYADATRNAAYSSTFVAEPELVDPKAYPSSGNCTVPKGVFIDPGPPYTNCLFDSQVREELSAYIAKNGLPTGPTQLYFLLLPHKVVTCFNQTKEEEEEKLEPTCSNNVFCAYHSFIGSGPSEIIYSDISFSLLDTGSVKSCQDDGNAALQHPNGDTAGSNESTRYADVALKYTSHEFIEAQTDPLPSEETVAWIDGNGLEIGDKCNGVSPDPKEDGIGYDAQSFTPTLGGSALEGDLFNQSINTRHYYLQSEWDNGAKACSMKPVPLEGAGFTQSSSSSLVGSPVSFSGTATDAYKGLGFTWTFGDGASAEGSSPIHAYAAPGAYKVTMTAKDGLTGATAPPVEHAILINDQSTASFTASPNPATPGAVVGFDGSSSSDPDGAIVTYSWQFGDGGSGGGVAPSHAYAGAGTYLVSLTVTDSAGVSATTTQPVTVIAARIASLAPNAEFSFLGATVDERTGTITFTVSVADSGRFSWLLTFQNGRFGVFAAKVAKCKPGFVRLAGRCRPARVVFAKGSKAVAAPGAVTFTIKPTFSAWKALRNALKRRTGVPVAATLSFQSARGGSPVTHARRLTVKLRGK